MSVYVALLRAIGPATHARMRPAALRDRAEEAGLGDPVNYLATGNLIFNSPKSVAVVKKEVAALVAGFGLPDGNEVFIATRQRIGRIVEWDPFPTASAERPGRLGVCFFHRELAWPEKLLKPEGPEEVAARGDVLVIDYGPGEGPSKLNVEKLAGARMTQRNWNTLRGIWERMKDR